MSAYYNEIDPYAAQWLRNLIAAGHIASGVVDERSIEDVIPDELREFTQCHFFAGIGVWSLALRNAGWPDDRPVWTGSCPCQPFSAAGQGGGFTDERHLWPHFFHLIEQCRPAAIFGEQVASRDANPWIDLVQDDLEGLGYRVGAVPFPSAGVGAPHIRDRLYWVAHTADQRQHGRRPSQAGYGRDTARQQSERFCDAGGLDHTHNSGLEGLGGGYQGPIGHGQGSVRSASTTGKSSGLANSKGERSPHGGEWAVQSVASKTDGIATAGPGPTNGLWSAADWLLCRDGKWRPVIPKPQPMVDGSSESLGRVRPGIIKEVEEEINAWTVESQIDRNQALRDLLVHLGAQAQRCWEAGRIPGLHEAPFLLAFLRQLTEQGWRVSERLPVSCQEVAEACLRSVRRDDEQTSPSHKYGLEGQQAGERADAMLVLSSLLARHAQEAWGNAHAAYAETSFPLANGARSRVGRLRGYGNAINAEAARIFIEAAMSCTPE